MLYLEIEFLKNLEIDFILLFGVLLEFVCINNKYYLVFLLYYLITCIGFLNDRRYSISYAFLSGIIYSAIYIIFSMSNQMQSNMIFRKYPIIVVCISFSFISISTLCSIVFIKLVNKVKEKILFKINK